MRCGASFWAKASPSWARPLGSPVSALRLLDRLADTLEAARLLARDGGLDAGALAELHATHGVGPFIHALVDHLGRLPDLAAPLDAAAEAVLLLVHGAALMRMAGHAHGDAEGRLGRSVSSLLARGDAWLTVAATRREVVDIGLPSFILACQGVLVAIAP